jgi:O-antigen ligase
LGWNQTPVALALTCSLLTFGKVDTRLKAGLWLVLGIFMWGLIQVDRIPVYLASAAVVLVVGFLKFRRLFAVMLIIFVILGVVFIKPLWNTEPSISSRQELARLALSIFRDHPVLGIGPTQYRSYAILYHPGWWKTVGSGMLLPHDVWLYFLADVGVVGFLGLLLVVGSMLWGPFSIYRRAEDAFSRVLAVSALACVAGVLVQSVGGHMGFLPDYELSSFYMVSVWILMGLVVARGQRMIEQDD